MDKRFTFILNELSKGNDSKTHSWNLHRFGANVIFVPLRSILYLLFHEVTFSF